MRSAVFNPRFKSLARANGLVWLGVVAAVLLSGFPRVHPDLWLLVPTAMVLAGTVDTLRNIGRRWSFYHAGVLLCVYMDLMAIFLVLFFLLYPYMNLGARAT